MKKPAMDPADLALERARQLKAVQLSRGGGDGPPDASAPEEEPGSTVEPGSPGVTEPKAALRCSVLWTPLTSRV
jgi:hypothetical protein